MNAESVRGVTSVERNRIHVWVAADKVRDGRLLSAYLGLMNKDERARGDRFRSEADRIRHCVTRALVRTALSRYAQVPAEDWTFAANQYGRPYATNPEARALGLHFNLSHTQGLIALAVARDRAVGIDVENCVARDVSVDLAGHYFSGSEAADIASLPGHMQAERFWEYWTLKEAYIKARGMGLHLPLDKFSFCPLDTGRVRINIDPELSDDPGRWQFMQGRLRPDWLLALCAEKCGVGQEQAPIFRMVVPLVDERPLAIEFACALESSLLGENQEK